MSYRCMTTTRSTKPDNCPFWCRASPLCRCLEYYQCSLKPRSVRSHSIDYSWVVREMNGRGLVRVVPRSGRLLLHPFDAQRCGFTFVCFGCGVSADVEVAPVGTDLRPRRVGRRSVTHLYAGW